MSTPLLELSLLLRPRICLAMQQSGLNPVAQIRVVHRGPRPLASVELRVSFSPEVADEVKIVLGGLAPGECHVVDEPVVRLRPGLLSSAVERTAGLVRLEAVAREMAPPDAPSAEPVELRAAIEEPFELLSPSEWPGGGAPLALLAAFVAPNDPAVAEMLRAAADLLASWTGNPALDGYQSRDPARVRMVAAAVYGALQRLDVTYVVAPASFEAQGQKVRSPTRLLADRMGNCVDSAVACAAALEQAGLRPMLFIVKGHAFCGVWLDEDELPVVTVEEPRRFLSLLDLGSIAVFDATAALTRPVVSFERAEQIARGHLGDTDAFHAGIDVRLARRQRVLPVVDPAEHEVRLERASSARAVGRATDAPGAERRLEVRERAGRTSEDIARATPAAALGERGARRLETWRAQLLDLTLRNRLLNHRDTARWIGVLVEAGDLDRELSRGGGLRLAPRLDAASGVDVDVDARRAMIFDELQSGRARTDLAPAELTKRGTGLFRLARVAQEEGGASALYAALGFLVWYEADASQREIEAPILLRPVRLERESATAPMRIARGDDEPFLNPTLVEKLRADFGIELDGLEELPRNEDGVDVELVLHRVRASVASQARWLVRETAGVGLFTFAKFLMYNDLVARADAILANPVARSIIEGVPVPRATGSVMPTSETVEDVLPPAATFCPLDADASQLAAIAAAVGGQSFVVQGPPGTGKSQTITNMIAQLLAEGKRVLFVSEKMAALEVVYRRLQAVGLAPFCLEVHGRDTSRRAVLDQLAEPLAFAQERTETGWVRHSEQLAERRLALNTYAREVGKVRAAGLSVFDAMGIMMRLRDVPWVPLALPDGAATITEARRAELRESAARWEAAARDVGPPREHPLRRVTRLWWSPTLPTSLPGTLARLGAALDGVEGAWRPLAAAASLPAACDEATAALLHRTALLLDAPLVPRSLLDAEPWDGVQSRVGLVLAVARERARVWEGLESRWLPAVVQRDPAPWMEVLRRPWWWLLLLFPLFAWLRVRSEAKALRAAAPAANDPPMVDDLDRVAAVRSLDAQIAEQGSALAGVLGWLWMEKATDWDAVEAAMEAADTVRVVRRRTHERPKDAAVGALVSQLATDTDRRATLGPLLRAWCAADRAWRDERGAVRETLAWAETEAAADRIEDVRVTLRALGAASAPVLRAWSFYLDARAEVETKGLAAMVGLFERGEVGPDRLVMSFEASFARWWSTDVIERTPALRQFNRQEHERRIRSFQELDRASLALASEEVRARLAARVPSPSTPHAQGSELMILLRELQKQRGHMALRRLMRAIPTLLPVLKPCFLMSPMSIAQHIDPSLDAFDVVIFDEASQIPSSDAIAALGRGRQAVVVGDTRQLPPTSFFQRSEADEFADETDFEELESILNECLASGLPEIYLRWHYRSNDESLIAFSNAHYYDHRLITFPSPAANTEDQGVRLVRVDGTYARGTNRNNRAEAEAVVAEVVRRLRDPEGNRESIGVITFSMPQQTLIEDLLDQARRDTPEIDRFFSSELLEPVFVKNLENVQGDERDTILFSICYGPDEHGRVAMNFGPLNREGGERRLNVAVTRARTRLIVFSSLDPDRIDLRRTAAVGVAHLKHFLQYAADGARALGLVHTVGGTFDSPFEKQVCDALRSRGWDVDTQVGCSGYRVDLAVRHPDRPGRHVLGIECDGATYHSSRSARERDRLRQQILETKMGWRLHRIWSTDWWIDPEGEIERAIEAIRDAIRDGAVAAVDEEVVLVSEPTPAPRALPEGQEAPSPDRRADIVAQFAQAPSVGQAPELLPGASPYLRADLGFPGGGLEGWRALGPAGQTRAVERVVAVEQPIAVRIVVMRLLRTFDIARRTPSFENEVQAAATRGAVFQDEDGFLWRDVTQREQWRGFRFAEGGERSRGLEEVPMCEIVEAFSAIVGSAGSVERDDLFRETLRVFGYSSLGAQLRDRLQQALDAAEQRGALQVREGRVAQAG